MVLCGNGMPFAVNNASIWFLKAPPLGGIAQTEVSRSDSDTGCAPFSGWLGRTTRTVFAVNSLCVSMAGRVNAPPGALITTSSSLRTSISSKSSSLPSTTLIATSLVTSSNRLTTSGIRLLVESGVPPTRSLPLIPWEKRLISSAADDSAASISEPCRARTRPAGVRRAPWRPRSTSFILVMSSIRWTLNDKAGWEILSSWAALTKLP